MNNIVKFFVEFLYKYKLAAAAYKEELYNRSCNNRQ